MDTLRNYINSVRRDFSSKILDEKTSPDNPYQLFETWFEEAVGSQILDPYAMVISTASDSAIPSSRVVYMRDISRNGLVFYTNYNSHKSSDLHVNPNISCLFYWAELDRQIRINGIVELCDEKTSDAYFASRPRESQIGAWASDQSSVIVSREELEERVKEFSEKFKDQDVPRPAHWGGFLVKPVSFEFWQGRPNRLHDRIFFSLKEDQNWIKQRLSP